MRAKVEEAMSLLPKSYQTPLMLALEIVLREFESLPVDIIKNFWNPAKCRADLLPYLAIMLGVTVWSEDLTISQKRKVCAEALIINRKKGTIGAIKRAIKTLNLNASIVEWFADEVERQSGTARVILQENEIIYDPKQYEEIQTLVNKVKRQSIHIIFEKRTALKTIGFIGASTRVTLRTINNKSKKA